MKELEKYKLFSIVVTFFLLSSFVVICDLNSRTNEYVDETTLIENEFTPLGMDVPEWNSTTRYFEVWDGNTAYVGYSRFNDMDTNIIEIVEFIDCEVVKIGGSYQYTASDENYTVISSREVKRRFEV